MKKYSTTALAKKYGVSSETIRRWIKEKTIDVSVSYTPGGHLRIIENNTEKEAKFIYARVSSKKQQSSLEFQITELQTNYPEHTLVTDIASAFNFQRKGLKTILESAMSGTPTEVVVTNGDRLARSGFGLIQWIIELSGGEIKSIYDEIETERFNQRELIGFITSFCNSYYGKRSADSKKRKRSNNKQENTDISRE